MSVQFSVTRVSESYFRIVVQNEKNIIRSYDVETIEVLGNLKTELEYLTPVGEYGHLKK